MLPCSIRMMLICLHGRWSCTWLYLYSVTHGTVKILATLVTNYWHVWFIPLADERGVCRQNCEIPWERVPYLSASEVCSRQGAIQIQVYLYLTLLFLDRGTMCEQFDQSLLVSQTAESYANDLLIVRPTFQPIILPCNNFLLQRHFTWYQTWCQDQTDPKKYLKKQSSTN